ncbi:MAG: hypothetical protein CBHOC_1988 [uncultured Caballeronia sp.]|nr:MAG: hypothetical protein CBHOC_1988 [uncultured Caballeronia sp.]
MACLDTNVLIRYLVRDNEGQLQQARQLIEQQIDGQQPLHIPHIPITVTLEWVLRARYSLGKKVVTDIYTRLLQAMELNFESEAAVEIALHHYKARNVDFADCHSRRARRNGQPSPSFYFRPKRHSHSRSPWRSEATPSPVAPSDHTAIWPNRPKKARPV